MVGIIVCYKIKKPVKMLAMTCTIYAITFMKLKKNRLCFILINSF